MFKGSDLAFPYVFKTYSSACWTVFKFWGKLDRVELHLPQSCEILDMIIVCSVSNTMSLWSLSSFIVWQLLQLSSCTLTEYQANTQKGIFHLCVGRVEGCKGCEYMRGKKIIICKYVSIPYYNLSFFWEEMCRAQDLIWNGDYLPCSMTHLKRHYGLPAL